MKLLYNILALLGMVATTICCNCEIRDWKWRHCGPNFPHALNMELTTYFTENCHDWVFNGTFEHDLGRIQSVVVECEGGFGGGALAISFSQSNGCTYIQPSPGEPETPTVRNLIPIICERIVDKTLDIVLPLNEDEKAAISALKGDFKLQSQFKNLNNLAGQSDCYIFSGYVHCDEEEDDY